MKNFLLKKIMMLVSIFLLLTSIGLSQEIKVPSDLKSEIPLDSRVKTGTLPNGIKYYVRENSYPKNRAELRIIVNAGSILEDDDQLGIAHFCEHMAFNGTKNFQKHELINFLESIGMKFGAELNAYTSFDETVYMLTIPLDKPQYLDTGIQILSEWAHNVSFEKEEIDKERGVIKEEWRLGQGAQERMSRQYFPKLFLNSHYADRMVIGKPEVFEKAPYDVFTRFYNDWYRPDLIAVAAVGDFKADDVIALINKYFSPIPKKENPRERKNYEVPDHDKTLVSITADKEFPYNLVQVFIKHDPVKQGSYEVYKENLIRQLYIGMLNERISEIAQSENPPFMFATTGEGSIVRAKSAYMLIGMAKNNQALATLKLLLTENERVKRFGFTRTELERQKLDMMKGMEKLYNERNQVKSANFASEIQRHHLEGEPMPGIEFEYELYKKFLPEITLEDVNALSAKLSTDKNMVIVMMFPEKKEIKLPKEKDVLKILNEVKNDQSIVAYVDKVIDKPLIEKAPTPKKVIAEKEIAEMGAVEWTLENGAKVIIKKTDFKNDEILMRAFSFGGRSVYPEQDDISAEYSADVIDMSGLGEFENVELQKLLAGKVVSVTPYISLNDEGFQGNSTPADFETLLQLTYLYFTQPRKDVKAYNNFITNETESLKNKGASPSDVFNDSIQAITNNYHKRFMPVTLDDLKKASHDRMMEIFRDRFSDASDFVFIFVGNIDLEKAKPLIEQYIGGLPSTNHKESFVDLNVKEPAGIVKRTIYKGKEPKATVYITFPGVFSYDMETRLKLDLMKDILNIRLRENIREDQSGTYGISAWVTQKKYPKESYSLNIYFGCAPENVDKLVAAVFDEINKLKTEGPSEINLNKVKETALRTREVNVRENRYWLNTINSYYYNKQNFSDYPKYEDIVKSFNQKDAMEYAKKYIDTNHYIQIVLMPEK